MRHIFYLLICFATLTFSCRRDNFPDATHQRLHGKYKAISSTTSELVDVNRDGMAGNDLLTEMQYLKNCDLEIRIVAKDIFLFGLFWPNQFISYGNDPEPVVNYACQGGVRSFSIASDKSTLELRPDNTPAPNPDLLSIPSSVTITGKDRIQVVLTKKIFTVAGWQSVTITTIYERYTMVT